MAYSFTSVTWGSENARDREGEEGPDEGNGRVRWKNFGKGIQKK